MEYVNALQKLESTAANTRRFSADTYSADPSSSAFKQFEAALEEADQNSQTAMLGQAEPHELVHSIAQTQLAVETVVTVRNKLVEAYQEILRMPV